MLCYYAECRILFTVMLHVTMLSAVMLSVLILSVIMLSRRAQKTFNWKPL